MNETEAKKAISELKLAKKGTCSKLTAK